MSLRDRPIRSAKLYGTVKDISINESLEINVSEMIFDVIPSAKGAGACLWSKFFKNVFELDNLPWTVSIAITPWKLEKLSEMATGKCILTIFYSFTGMFYLFRRQFSI